MGEVSLKLSSIPEKFAVCRLGSSAEIPAWALDSFLYSISRTPDELSIVTLESVIPPNIRAEHGWKCLKVEGPLDFSLTGVLASPASPLAGAKISIFAISTFDTDYLLIKEDKMGEAKEVLRKAGHSISD